MAAERLYDALQKKPDPPVAGAEVTAAHPFIVPEPQGPSAAEQWGAVRDDWVTTERERIDANAKNWGDAAFTAARGTPHPSRKKQ
jgi:hypothetical protein